ncbi:FadR/GntR family transcriptional regulator [Leptothrix sp. BB-4]
MATRIPAYRQAQIEIKRFIEARQLGVGDALPPEATLASELGISRPSLREGLKALESLGIIESRHGEGVFVAAFSFDTIIENLPYSRLADASSVADLLQVRAAIELGLITEVVDRIEPQDIEKLRGLAETMIAKARAGGGFEDQDGEFHATLFQCLNNGFLNRLLGMFWQVHRRLHEANHLEEQQAFEESAREHLQIVEMLEARDKNGLLEAHRQHFHAGFERLDVATSLLKKPAAGPVVRQSRSDLEPLRGLNLQGRLDRLQT